MASETNFLVCTSPPRLIVLWHIYIYCYVFVLFVLFCEAVVTGEAKVISNTSGHGREYSL